MSYLWLLLNHCCYGTCYSSVCLYNLPLYIHTYQHMFSVFNCECSPQSLRSWQIPHEAVNGNVPPTLFTAGASGTLDQLLPGVLDYFCRSLSLSFLALVAQFANSFWKFQKNYRSHAKLVILKTAKRSCSNTDFNWEIITDPCLHIWTSPPYVLQESGFKCRFNHPWTHCQGPFTTSHQNRTKFRCLCRISIKIQHRHGLNC